MRDDLIKPFAVIFDMDGVLVDSRAAHLKSWQRLGEETAHYVSEEEFSRGFGRTSREVIRESFGAADEDQIKRLDLRKEAIYRDIIRGNIPVMPGADDLVRRLHKDGIPLAVGSSGPPENVHLVLDSMAWSPLFSAVVTGADVTRGKPDPQVFLLAAERLHIPAAECVVVEDALVGVEAAKRAGMRVIALTTGDQAHAFGSADMRITRLSEFSVDRVCDWF